VPSCDWKDQRGLYSTHLAQTCKISSLLDIPRRQRDVYAKRCQVLEGAVKEDILIIAELKVKNAELVSPNAANQRGLQLACRCAKPSTAVASRRWRTSELQRLPSTTTSLRPKWAASTPLE
jgi:hypothetical protein